MARLRLGIQPPLCFGRSRTAASFNHVSHQGPLLKRNVYDGSSFECRPYRSTRETDEGHFAFQLVPSDGNGIEYVAQLLLHVECQLELVEIFWVLDQIVKFKTLEEEELKELVGTVTP